MGADLARTRFSVSRGEASVLFVALVAVASCGVLWWTSQLWAHAVGAHIPALDSLAQARQAATQAYLLTSERQAGDRGVAEQTIFALLDRARLAARDGITDRSTLIGIAARSTDDAQLRSSQEEYQSALAAFDRVTREAVAGAADPAQSAIQLRTAFHETERIAEDINSRLVLGFTTSIEEQRHLQAVTLVLWLGFLALASLKLIRMARTEDAGRARLLQERAALRASEDQLRLALDATDLGTWQHDLATDLVHLDARARQCHGVDTGQIAFSKLITLMHPDDVGWVGREIAAAHDPRTRSGGRFAAELRVVHPNGDVRWLSVRAIVQFEEDGTGRRLSRVFGTCQDITARRAMDRELRQLNSDLEQRVVERTAQLVAANQELDAFAYAVAHNLRTPLRALSGFSHALLEDCGAALNPEGLAHIDQIMAASRSMGELVDGLLQLSRRAKGELCYDIVDVSSLVYRIRNELEQIAPLRSMEWQVEPGMVVRGDMRMTEVIVRSLLENAWKYTGRTMRPVIRVYSQTDGGRQWISVSDNGAGFDPAHAGKLFLPFQRLHRQDEFPGIGIGLATVQRIVQRHGGELRAAGTVGKGATFSFTLSPPGVMEEAA